MMDYLEAARRIEDHLRVPHMKEQPRCEKITEALTLATKVLEQYSNLGGVVARYMGVPMECHHISPDEAILLRFEMFEHDLTTVERVFNSVRQEFPYNKIVVLPKNMDFDGVSLESIVGIKAHIDSILEAR